MEAVGDGEMCSGKLLHALLSWVVPSSANVPLQAEERKGKREEEQGLADNFSCTSWPDCLQSSSHMLWLVMQTSLTCNFFLPSRTTFVQRSNYHHPWRTPLDHVAPVRT